MKKYRKLEYTVCEIKLHVKTSLKYTRLDKMKKIQT